MPAPCVQCWLSAHLGAYVRRMESINGSVGSQQSGDCHLACVLKICSAHHLHHSCDAGPLLLTFIFAMDGAA